MYLQIYWKYSQSFSTFLNLQYLIKFYCSIPCFDFIVPLEHLRSIIPIISSGLRIMVSIPLFVMSNMALLHVNFSFIINVL